MGLLSRISKRLFESSYKVISFNILTNFGTTPLSQSLLFYNKFGNGLRCVSTSKILFFPSKVSDESKKFSKSEDSGSSKSNPQVLFTHVSETFPQGKYRGTGLPKPVGQPDDLPCIEFGKPTGMYNFVRHQHGDPRGHLQEDGRFKDQYATDNFHWYDAYTDVPKQRRTLVNGEPMVLGVETRPMEELYGLEQTNIPFFHRRRINLWGNHTYMLRAEFCFFWIPTFIIFSLVIPCFTMLYMLDEAVNTTMTVKVIGHQWYWVYEVESPALE